MLQSISTTQPTVDKLAASGNETPSSAHAEEKHLDYQKQQSSSSMKANTTNDDSFQVVTKRRNQKQQSKLDGKVTKVSTSTKKVMKKRPSETTNEVATLTAEEGSRTDQDLASGEEEGDNSNSDPSFIGGYSKKKQQYMEQAIADRSGTYNFVEDPQQYKKARKRLQNRESAVRSRMKKRQEMDVLEDQVRELTRQKAAIEASNEELKRQNKYWEELFAKQQLSALPTPATAQLQVPVQQMQKNRSMPESQDLTQPSHELSYIEEASDPSYENLEMTRGEFLKRQKLSMDDAFYGNGSQKTPQVIKDSIPMRNISFGGQLPALSEGKPTMEEQKDLLGQDEAFNIDDVLIDRSAGGYINNSSFLGLAVMCGSIGMASFMQASSPAQASNTSVFYSGSRQAGTDHLPKSEPVSIKNQGEEVVDSYAEPSPQQNMILAFELIMQALMTMPVMAYISFALSFVFMVLYLANPLSYLAKENNHSKRMVRKSHRTHKSSSQASNRQKKGKAQAVRAQ